MHKNNSKCIRKCEMFGVCLCSAHALTADVCIAETARAAEFFLSDGVVVTGVSTGVQANPQELNGEFQLNSSSNHQQPQLLDS